MDCVLDACAILAYLRAEAGGEVVAARLQDPSCTCFAHIVNIWEVYYIVLREQDETTAEGALNALISDGLVIRRDSSAAFWKAACNLKAVGGISLADCFCVHLAMAVSGEVLTTDRNEFDRIIHVGLCPITYIR